MQHSPQKLHLNKFVFFKKIGNEVYVRNVATGEEFIFSGEAASCFSALRRGLAHDAPALAENKLFLRELASYGLLDSPPSRTKKQSRKEQPIPLEYTPKTFSSIPGYFQEIRRRKHQLWSACLELTYRCNEHCQHCYLDVHEEQTTVNELTGKEWLDVIDQLARMGCMKILVTGGEPTLHPAFLDVCKHIINRGMLCDVYTNGLAISDILFDSLCNIPINSISVSLYAGTEAFHDEITGVPGSFQKTLTTLLRFKNAGFDAYAKTPVFHKHLDDYFAAKELGRKHGFRVLASNFLTPGHSGKTRNLLMMDALEYRSFLEHEAIPDTRKRTAPDTSKGRLDEPICHAGQSTLCLTPFGDVLPCNSFLAACGNIKKTTLSNIWRTSDILRYLRKVRRRDISPKCATCKDIAYCTVCPGASWNETHGHIVPTSWSCEQTQVRSAFNHQAKEKS